MGPKKFAQLEKRITQAGKWHCGATESKGKMNKESFPLSRGRGYILGTPYHWRVDHWEAGPMKGRLLIAYHLGKENYLAWLSIERGPKEYAVALCLEYHGDHPGWHVHTGTGPVKDFAVGCTRQRILGIRKPGKGSYHRPRRAAGGELIEAAGMSQITALNIAYRAFRIVDATADKDLFS
jgi:hypothetical protein